MQLRRLVMPWGVSRAFGMSGAGALTLGQVDDFESLLTAGREVGLPHPAPPIDLRSGLQDEALRVAFSTQAVALAPGNGWTPLFFPLDATLLTGSAEALGGVTALRLDQSQDAACPGPAAAALLGLGNTAVPEPMPATLLAPGLVSLAARHLRL